MRNIYPQVSDMTRYLEEDMLMDDYQQQQLYDAEKVVYKSSKNVTKLSMFEPSLYLKKVTNSDWWNYCLGPNYVDRVYYRNNRGFGECVVDIDNTITIYLPKYARSDMYILHELAHAIQPRPSSHHGPEFVQTYLLLIQIFSYKPHNLFRDLLNSFTDHGVKFGWQGNKPFWAEKDNQARKWM